MRQLYALFLLLPTCLLCSNCAFTAASAAEAQNGKTMDPAIAEEAQKEGCWYTYLPEKAPGFCLRTRITITWEDPKVDVGYWQGLSPYPPHQVIMEAKGNTFILHAGYEWDGNSVGHTGPEHLMPSLRHDALYHALKEGAPLDRAQIDAAYKADCEKYGAAIDKLAYGALRLFGGAFNDAGMHGTLIIKKTEPAPGKP